MKRTGIIHAELARYVAGLRHTDTFVICDSGLPLAPGTPVVDLGYRYGQATFADVSATVLGEVVVEHSWVSRDVLTVSPHVYKHLVDLDLEPEPVDHVEFKAAVLDVAFAVRTGEDTFFANVLCRAGVPFGPGGETATN
jgi:D-ribose pyranase